MIALVFIGFIVRMFERVYLGYRLGGVCPRPLLTLLATEKYRLLLQDDLYGRAAGAKSGIAFPRGTGSLQYRQALVFGTERRQVDHNRVRRIDFFG